MYISRSTQAKGTSVYFSTQTQIWVYSLTFCLLYTRSQPGYTHNATLQPVINQAKGNLGSSDSQECFLVFGVPPLGSQCDGNRFHLCRFHVGHMEGWALVLISWLFPLFPPFILFLHLIKLAGV